MIINLGFIELFTYKVWHFNYEVVNLNFESSYFIYIIPNIKSVSNIFPTIPSIMGRVVYVEDDSREKI